LNRYPLQEAPGMQQDSRAPPTTSPTTSPVIFTLRLWQEPINDEQYEWRGELKNLATGEVRYIRLWAEIAQFIPAMLGERACIAPITTHLVNESLPDRCNARG